MKRTVVVLALICAATGFAADAPTSLERVGPAEPYEPYEWSSSADRAILWDNGDTDGLNGYSAGTAAAIGSGRRAVLDDFVIAAGQVAWDIDNMSWLILWGTLTPPQATGAEISFRNDVGSAPDVTSFATANVTGVTENTTGRVWFGREEAELSVDFDPVNIVEGTYWVDFLPVGPENSFTMTRATVTGSECWVDYDDLGGLQSGTTQFGAAADLSFVLNGTVVPVELQAFTIN